MHTTQLQEKATKRLVPLKLSIFNHQLRGADLTTIACEQAPSEIGKKIRRASRNVVTPRAKRLGSSRSP